MDWILEKIDLTRWLDVRTYLLMAGSMAVLLLIVFDNAGFLPMRPSDFAFMAVIVFLAALCRPGWTFLLFLMSIPLENVVLFEWGLAVRPYQLLAAAVILSLAVKKIPGKLSLDFPKWNKIDSGLLVLGAGGFLSSFFSPDPALSFRLAVVLVSFLAIYFLVRLYVQNREDVSQGLPFLVASSAIVVVYGIWQNWRFTRGLPAFEVMSGRPNATFSEPDWFGMFLVIVIAVAYAIIYHSNATRYKTQDTRHKIQDTRYRTQDLSYKLQDTRYKQVSIFNFQILRALGFWNFGNWLLFVSCFLFLEILYVGLILTVARSAWLGATAVTLAYLGVVLTGLSISFRSWDWKRAVREVIFISASFAAALIAVAVLNLTNFELGSRAQSTGTGLQKITVACDSDVTLPETIQSVGELEGFGCRHINLEDIGNEKSQGKIIKETNRPDPNVGIRGEIYRKSWEQIKRHPIVGIGWGSIGDVLGRDERGAALNSSNIFLEVWLGSGILGLVAFVFVWILIVVRSIRKFVVSDEIHGSATALFVLLGVVAIIIPNLFNAGIFLAFLWVYLAVAASLLTTEE